MKSYRDTMIIGIDHGYGNVKTAGCCFPTGISAFDDEPVFKDNLLIYQNRYYLIGEGHKAFAADKTVDEETYILTLAAMARELSFRNLTEAKVLLAVGLPLTRKKNSSRLTFAATGASVLPSVERIIPLRS